MHRKPVSKVVNGSQRTILTFFSASSKNVNEKGNKEPEKNQEARSQETVMDNVEVHGTPQKKAKLGPQIDSNNGICNTTTQSESLSAPLTPEQRKSIKEKASAAKLLKASKILKVLDPKMGLTWFSALEDEFRKDYFKQLNDFVVSANDRVTIFPPADNIWEWTKQYPIQNVKVVILGQDPYHGRGQAHGLCFSVQKGIPPPPSLLNMYKELETDIEGFSRPDHGCLQGWANQGVLLLNAVLTVESGKANSHKDKGWEKITDAVISWMSTNLDSVVFLLWGSSAQKKAACVDKKKHYILQGPHPSPLSVHRGFFGCKHFSRCNDFLETHGKQPIDWKHLP